MGEVRGNSIRVCVLPLEWDEPIKFETQFRPQLHEALQIANIRDVKLIPQYQLVIEKVTSEPVITRK
jgi:hypothetical protein